MTLTTRTLLKSTEWVSAWTALAVILALPAYFSFQSLGNINGFSILADTLGLIGFVAASTIFVRYAPMTWLIGISLLVCGIFFERVVFAGVTAFSGRTLNADFFIHLNMESVAMTWRHYRHYIIAFVIGSLALVLALRCITQRHIAPNMRCALLLVCISVVLTAYADSPEKNVAAGIHAWLDSTRPNLPDHRMTWWEKSPLIHLNPPRKDEILATAPDAPKNLILLYIESGAFSLAHSDRHPDLMPHMAKLIDEHGYLPHILASSYITIEGIANTQCGTLFSFDHREVEKSGLDTSMNQLPCLGDVLRAAGYRQTYMGGARKSFAGKGKFLSTHGFDKVIGLEDWKRQGFEQRPETSGLSDVELFQQSFVELQKLKESGRPFNLTLLTIGTHIPGFAYKECLPYGDGNEPYLDAVYCSDQLIRRWVNKLDSDDWLDDDTLLVITADHNIFPNDLMKRLFGDEAVKSQRLPLVIIGKDVPPPIRKRGAGVDIAPTVLDLLGINTNAQFILGRSLLRDERKMDYFPSRYIEFFEDQQWAVEDSPLCDENSSRRVPGEQALSHCERAELAVILQMQERAYSGMPW